MLKSKLFDAARVALDQCLGVRANETVLIVTDPARWELAVPFRKVAAEMGAEALLLEMDERQTHGSEPPRTGGRGHGWRRCSPGCNHQVPVPYQG